MTQLSPHFSLDELTVTEHRLIDNSPTLDIEDNLKFLALNLERVRTVAAVPIVVTSAYRCRELNTAVGGAANSDHVFGLAADCRAVGLTVTELFLRLYDARIDLNYRQMIHEYGRWVHIAFEKAGSGQIPKNPLDQTLVIKTAGKYERYIPGMEL